MKNQFTRLCFSLNLHIYNLLLYKKLVVNLQIKHHVNTKFAVLWTCRLYLFGKDFSFDIHSKRNCFFLIYFFPFAFFGKRFLPSGRVQVHIRKIINMKTFIYSLSKYFVWKYEENNENLYKYGCFSTTFHSVCSKIENNLHYIQIFMDITSNHGMVAQQSYSYSLVAVANRMCSQGRVADPVRLLQSYGALALHHKWCLYRDFVFRGMASGNLIREHVWWMSTDTATIHYSRVYITNTNATWTHLLDVGMLNVLLT